MRRRREWGGGGYQLVQPATLEGYSERHRTMPWVHGEGVSPSWKLILSFLGPSGFPLQFSLQLHPNGCPQAVLGLSRALHLWQSERKRGPQVKVQRGSLTLTLSTVVSPEGIFPLQLRSPFVLGKALGRERHLLLLSSLAISKAGHPQPRSPYSSLSISQAFYVCVEVCMRTVLHWFMYLDAWSPIGGAVWGRLWNL